MKLHTYIIASLLALATTATAQERLVTVSPAPLSLQTAAARQGAQAPLLSAPNRVLASTEGLLGYCDGDSITTRDAYFGTAGTYQVGAWLTNDALKDYAGCKVVGIRFALSQSIGKTTCYLYGTDGNQAGLLVEKSLRRTSEGWNELRFNSAQEYTLTGEEGLVYTFDYVETEEMATAAKGALCAYKSSSSNSYAALLYQNGNFASLSGVGNICIQLIVDMSSLPAKSVKPQMLLAGNKYKKPGDTIDAFLQYANTGREDIASCQWGYRIDDGEIATIDQVETLGKGKTSSVEKEFKLPAELPAGAHTLKFFVTQLDGEAVAAADTITNNFVLYQSSLARQKHYVEQYTSQQSYYASLVDEQMSSCEGDDICLVNVHKAGTSLAIEPASYLGDLYAYTWPCFTIDRFYFFGEAYVAFDVNDYAAIMPDLVGGSVRELVSEAAANPAFATVEIEPAYDSTTRTLTLTVSGDVASDAQAIFGDMALTVLLAEDSVVAPQTVLNSAGTATTTNRKYVHNQVLRTYLTAPTGDRLSIADGRYTTTVSGQLDTAWKPENMKAVAFVTKAADSVSDDNVLDMDITNANSVSLKEVASGISQAVSDTVQAKEYYTLDGTRVNAQSLRSGIYIVREGGQAKKVLVK